VFFGEMRCVKAGLRQPLSADVAPAQSESSLFRDLVFAIRATSVLFTSGDAVLFTRTVLLAPRAYLVRATSSVVAPFVEVSLPNLAACFAITVQPVLGFDRTVESFRRFVLLTGGAELHEVISF
jgi:hypothetical protein